MIYLDTNIFVSLLAEDAGSVAAQEWWAGQTVPLGTSTWVAAEFYSHIGLRCRKGEESTRNAARIIDAFDTLVSINLSLLKSSDAAVLRAASWLRSPECSLQASDALHLAIAVENEAAAIATFDQRYARGIEKLRIAGLKVIALTATGTPHKIRQKLANYNVTERDVAKAVKWARKRKLAEREKAPRLLVRG
jgi:predicted nucleic acid-binding protein